MMRMTAIAEGDFQYPHIALGGGDGERVIVHGRREDHFHELPANDGLRGGGIQRTVESDDAAKSGSGIGAIGAFVGTDGVFRHRDAARVGVLDDDAGGCLELAHAFPSGVGIRQVVEGEFLALTLAEARQRTRLRLRLAVERGLLVRVLAVAQVLHLDEAGVELVGEGRSVGNGVGRRIEAQRGQVVTDGRVVLRDAVEGRDRECEARRPTQPALTAQGVDQRGVLPRVGQHRDMGPVLGGRAQHRRAADIDILDGLVQGAAGTRHRRLKGVEIEYQQVDGRDAVFGHHRIVHAPATQQPAMDFRVQRLDAAVHDLGKTGVGRDFGDRQPGLLERLVSAAGGEQFYLQGGERLGEFEETGLVGDRQQGATDRRRGRHGRRALRRQG
jgi:hypothetical protein